jgi:hypothetical protein
MWSLLFLTLAASTALAAFGPANNDDDGARIAAIVLAVIFIPMGIAPLLLALARGRQDDSGTAFGAVRATSAPIPSWPPGSPVTTPTPTVAPGPVAGTDDDDPLAKIEKLGELRARGLITQEEFDEQKRRLLDEI